MFCVLNKITIKPIFSTIYRGFCSSSYSLLSTSLDRFVKEEVEPQATEFNRLEKFNEELFKKAGELGFLSVLSPDTYLGAQGISLVLRKLAYSDPGFALSVLAHVVLFINNLAVNGYKDSVLLDKNVVDDWIERASSGDILCGMCMSEASGGTDVLNMKSHLIKSNDKYLLNGSKMWITNGVYNNGQVGDGFLVYFKNPTENTPKNISLALVNGCDIKAGSKINGKCGMRSSNTAELVFDNIEIKKEDIISENGIVSMMKNLEIERIALSAISVGISDRCIDEMTKYSYERHSFGHPIAHFGQIQSLVSRSLSEHYAMSSFLDEVCREYDNNYINGTNKGRIRSDCLKLFAASTAKTIADRGIQVAGGNGYIEEYVVERLWRDAKLIEIGGGTNEAHEKNIMKDLRQGIY